MKLQCPITMERVQVGSYLRNGFSDLPINEQNAFGVGKLAFSPLRQTTMLASSTCAPKRQDPVRGELCQHTLGSERMTFVCLRYIIFVVVLDLSWKSKIILSFEYDKPSRR